MDKIERLKNHIKVLNKSYENIILVMDDDLEKKKDANGQETDELVLKDDKIKTYAEGIKKSAETLDFLFSEITKKESELEIERNIISDGSDAVEETQKDETIKPKRQRLN